MNPDDPKLQVRVLARVLGEVALERDHYRDQVTALQDGQTRLVNERRASLTMCVRSFFVMADQPIPHVPDEKADGEQLKLGLRLIVEEFCELLHACGVITNDVEGVLHRRIENALFAAFHSVDLPKVIDGVADLKYVAEGLAVRLGVDMRPIDAAVHKANMAKRGGPKDENGKHTKPPGWSPPDIDGLLREQGWRGP